MKRRTCLRLLMCILVLMAFSYISNAGTCAHPKKQDLNNKDTSQVKYFPLIFQLPNDQWNLVVYDPPSHYLFKRNPITDSAGYRIVPAIMIYSEDATSYKQNIAIFSSKKLQPFLDQGVGNLKFLTWHDKDYPLTYKNAIFIKGNYSEKGLKHVIYMIYIIDKHNKGLQIYLDMTTDIAKVYEIEFWKTIRSLKEMP